VSDHSSDENPEVKTKNRVTFTNIIPPIRFAAANMAVNIAQKCYDLYNSDIKN